ncbi:MAG: topoisomerase DNA-binding C4 zinc finger domain-containing protein [Anaeromyxobacter sp.]|nr:topoisomerase DNA-binding C4 zinc finger domain-containing protein [Anaeromyxobacter sp.]MBL0274952.1 topoisomerase DNA-binding C4 zinc finger domain-containing protein [Anaeromyxobacter sp.]
MAVRWGRRGEFLACSGYPGCRRTRDIRRVDGAIEVVTHQAVEAAAEPCPKCGAAMAARRGRFGVFLACTRRPACDGARAPSTGVSCPRACGGEVVERRSQRGKTFFGCSTWPGCDFVSWDRPVGAPCPDCGGTWLVEVVSRRLGPALACPDKNCGYRRAVVGGTAGRDPSA